MSNSFSRRHKWLIMSLGLALTACVSIMQPQPLVNVPATLTQGASITLRPGLSISFDRVDDSRCPQNAKCVWAGRLLYLLTLHDKQDEPFTLGTSNQRFTSRSGLTVDLLNRDEPPAPILGQPPPAYTVMLLINSN